MFRPRKARGRLTRPAILLLAFIVLLCAADPSPRFCGLPFGPTDRRDAAPGELQAEDVQPDYVLPAALVESSPRGPEVEVGLAATRTIPGAWSALPLSSFPPRLVGDVRLLETGKTEPSRLRC